LEKVKNAYTKTELKIINADGKDITKEHFAEGKATDAPACTGDVESKTPADAEKILLGVTRRATDMSLGRRVNSGISTSLDSKNIRPAVLLTENENTRAHAKTEKLVAMAPSVLRKHLVNGITRIRALSRGPQSRPELETTTPPPVGSPVGIKGLDDAAADQVMENGP
jgi:hypothetical protein